MFVRKYKVSSIDWDTDGEDVELPTKMILDVKFGENPQNMDVASIDDCIADALSDVTGWCVKNFEWEYMDDSPTAKEILGRVKKAIKGRFDSVAVNADGTIVIKDGDGVYVLSVVKCEKCED